MNPKARWWVLACLLVGTALVVCMLSGLRRVLDTGQPSAGSLHYMFATILAGLLFVALAGLEHHDSDTTTEGALPEAEDDTTTATATGTGTGAGTATGATTNMRTGTETWTRQ